MGSSAHWDKVYRTKSADAVSWYQPHATSSFALIRATGLPPTARIIDVGGGASTLVDDLFDGGFQDVSVLDISAESLAVARERLGSRAWMAKWVVGDIRTLDLPEHHFDVWHDRAVFHFLTDAADRAAYVRQVKSSVRFGGHVIVATFAPDGPDQCSGLPVLRYAPDQLHDEFGAEFQLVAHRREDHVTPGGAIQHFIYCHCRIEPSTPPK